jgi:steroid Delta-isomerase
VRRSDEEDLMPTPEQVRAAVDAYVEAYNRNDRQAFLDAFAADGVIVDPVGTPPHVGIEARGAFWDGVHQLSESLKLDAHDLHVAGDGAAMVFTVLARTGDSGVAMDAVDVFSVSDDGRITRLEAYWDMTRARPI